MPNQRKQGKKKIGVWVTDDEEAQIKAVLVKHGMKNVAELLKAVREGTVKISPHIKTIALAAMGTQTGGAGCLWFFLAIPAAIWLLSQPQTNPQGALLGKTIFMPAVSKDPAPCQNLTCMTLECE